MAASRNRIPFLARWPGRIAESFTPDEPLELNDLPATCAGLLGRKLEPEAAPDNVDLSLLLLGKSFESTLRSGVVSHSENGSLAIRVCRWKLIEGTDGSGG